MSRPEVTCSRRGKPFEEEIERSLKQFSLTHRCEWERFYDVSDYVGRSCPKCHAPITHCNNPNCKYTFPELGMLPPKRKADFWLLHEGKHYLLECKSTNGRNGFRFIQYNGTPTLKDHQKVSLINHMLCKGVSWVLICNRSSPRKPHLYVLDIRMYANMECESKFISWEDVERVSIFDVERTPYKGEPYYMIEECLV